MEEYKEYKEYEIEVLTKLARIETILKNFEKTEENFKKVEEKVIETHNLSKENEKRLDKIEDNNKWLFRTTIGAVLTGVIAIVLNLIK